jgi:NAD(P)-dependent dehydrogenase (short-subunit alcohol dehydrogenase family)
VRPLDEQTILVTGATDGHGRALATELARGGACVLVHGRDDDRGRATVAEIRGQTGNDRIHWHRADLSSLDEVRALAGQVAAGHDRLDAIVNNAGIGTTNSGRDRRLESRDGFELRFAVNYLAGYLLTRMLLARAQAAPPGRIVNVSSAGQAPIDFDDVMLERGYNGVRAYCQSKLAQIMFTFDLAEELAGTGTTANCLHPGTYMPTKMVREGGIDPVTPLQDGVRATLRLVADPQLDGDSGRYYNGQAPAEPHPQANDREARARLRKLSDRLCGLDRASA